MVLLPISDHRELMGTGTFWPSRAEKSIRILTETLGAVENVCQCVFSKPVYVQRRRYEALRSVLLDRRPEKDVVEEFGSRYESLRQMTVNFGNRVMRPTTRKLFPFF